MNTINAKTKDLQTVNQTIKAVPEDESVTVKNASHIHGLAAGLKHGEVLVQGDAGDYLGVLNDGATIIVTGSVGKYAADNMTGGTVIIRGNAAYGVAQYCYAGTVVVHGDAGDFTATMNKGATVIIAGDIGDEAGTYMLKGDLIVVGNAGENLANYLICGSVYIGGTWTSLGHNTRLEPLNDVDIIKLSAYLEQQGIEAPPTSFKKIVAASPKPFYKKQENTSQGSFRDRGLEDK